MVGFHVPSFTIDNGHLIGGQGGIVGHQILNPRAAIFVCKNLLDQQKREIDTFQIDFHRGIRLKCQLIEKHPLPVTFGLLTQGNLAITLKRHDEVLVQIMLDEHHVFGGTVPHITQHILKQNLVTLGRCGQAVMHLVMAHAASQQSYQACPGGLSEGTDEIVTIDAQQFFVFHSFSLSLSA